MLCFTFTGSACSFLSKMKMDSVKEFTRRLEEYYDCKQNALECDVMPSSSSIVVKGLAIHKVDFDPHDIRTFLCLEQEDCIISQGMF